MNMTSTIEKVPCYIVHGEDSENNLYDSYVFYDVKKAQDLIREMADRERSFQKQEWNEDFVIIPEDNYSIVVQGKERKDTWFRFFIEVTSIE